MLQAPEGIRERMLVMGGYGTGKTSTYLNIAKWSKETESDARFHVLDTDFSVRHMLSVPTSQYANLDNIVLYEVTEYKEYLDAIDKANIDMRPNDWLCIDFMSEAWEATQTHYVDEIYRAGLGEFFLQQAKANPGDNPLDGWKDWSVINKMYKDISNRILRSPGHVLMTAQAKVLGDKDDRAMRALFGAHGVRPAGQKALGYLPHTILLAKAVKPSEIYLTTVKDRERPAMSGEAQLNEFALDYLVTIAGWRLV